MKTELEKLCSLAVELRRHVYEGNLSFDMAPIAAVTESAHASATFLSDPLHGAFKALEDAIRIVKTKVDMGHPTSNAIDDLDRTIEAARAAVGA